MKDNIKVHVDLTEKRQSLLKSASNLVEDFDMVLFCYADINCRLKIKWKNEPREDHFFTSIDVYNNILHNNKLYNYIITNM